MYLFITAFPQMEIMITLIDENENVVLDTQVWYDDIVPEIHDIKEEYEVNKVFLRGPDAFIERIAENIKTYNNIDVEIV